jgi:hypothetical protein
MHFIIESEKSGKCNHIANLFSVLFKYFPVQSQVEDLARLSFQTPPVYVDVDDGRKKVMPPHFYHDFCGFVCSFIIVSDTFFVDVGHS